MKRYCICFMLTALLVPGLALGQTKGEESFSMKGRVEHAYSFGYFIGHFYLKDYNTTGMTDPTYFEYRNPGGTFQVDVLYHLLERTALGGSVGLVCLGDMEDFFSFGLAAKQSIPAVNNWQFYAKGNAHYMIGGFSHNQISLYGGMGVERLFGTHSAVFAEMGFRLWIDAEEEPDYDKGLLRYGGLMVGVRF